MQNTQKDRNHYPDVPPPLPEYDISPLKKLVLICIGTMLINFLIAGVLAMRIIQIDVHIRHMAHLGIPDNVLFYSLLTSHGQVMFLIRLVEDRVFAEISYTEVMCHHSFR
jgi:hypothetical protein